MRLLKKKMQHQISFLVQPIKTCDMEYEVDLRKDKPLKGQNNFDEPVVQIFDSLRRSGELRVVSVAHLADDKNNKYNLHPNLLCNLPRKQQFCNESGVATYKFNTEMYNNDKSVSISLKNLCIRHSVKKNFNEFVSYILVSSILKLSTYFLYLFSNKQYSFT